MAESREEYDFIRYGSSALSLASSDNRRGFVEVPPWLPTGVSPVQYVLNWGAFEADNVIAVHCVHVDNEDIRKLKEHDVAVAVCPRCNAQLSMGVAPVADFLRSGLRVGLGTGYSVATNASDIIKEMRVGLLLNRAVNPGRFIATATMLRMATIDAARALRMEDEIGSIEIGKRADLAVVDLSDSRQVPTDDPTAAVINSCSAADVLMTMVGGDIRYEKNQWHLDVEVARDIARVTKPFYDSWDDETYERYLRMFALDESKTPRELSEGMKVKCNLLFALSHGAEALILDEPTSGLDPFSRVELLELFEQIRREGVAVFFSTHIISDIEKCADDIIYISKGRIVAACPKEEFADRYQEPGETLEEAFLRLERGAQDA